MRLPFLDICINNHTKNPKNKMKKIILLSVLVLALASCSTPAPVEETPVVDSVTCVKADTVCTQTTTTVAVDTTKVK